MDFKCWKNVYENLTLDSIGFTSYISVFSQFSTLCIILQVKKQLLKLFLN